MIRIGRRSARRLLAATLVAAIGVSLVGVPVVDPVRPLTASTAGPATGRLVPVEPCRLLDSRTRGGPLVAGTTVRVEVAGRCGVPADAIAVAVTVTSVAAPSSGWLSVFPSGTRWPGTSTLNVAPGEVRANGALVRLGDDGALSVLVEAGGHLLVDVAAAFLSAGAAAAGRFVDTGQRRVLDTRSDARPAPGGSVRVPLPAMVPSDATALLINLTTSDTRGPGFFTVYPAGGRVPEASVLNTDGPGQTRAATTIVPVSAGGFDVLTSGGDHVIVDLVGYFTGPRAAVADTGLFVPIAPVRLTDTRLDGPQLYRGGTREWATTEVVGGRAQAIVANLTMVDPDADGWVLAHPARSPLPTASSVNAHRSSVVANLTVSPVSTAGLAVHSSGGTHIVADVTGWFTGEPRAASGPPPENAMPGPGRTLIVGDSVAAAFRWATPALRHFTVLDHVLDVRTCRTTVGTSCAGPGGVRPLNGVDAIRSAGPGFDTVAVLTGYNDWNVGFASAIDQVMTVARAGGASEVVWFTLRTDSVASNHARNNAHLRDALARHPDLRLADWNTHAAGRRSWFAADGVHLTVEGADALARFIVGSLTS